MSRAKRNVASSTDDAMVFHYDIYYVELAALDVRDKPVSEMYKRMDILDSKIKILHEHISASFGKLANELGPR